MKPTPTYLIVCALKSEYQALVAQVKAGQPESYGGIEGWGFTLPIGHVFIVAGRIGKVATAFELGVLSAKLALAGIINTGVAGTLSPTVEALAVVIATKVAFYDVDLTAFGNPLGQMDGHPLWFEPGAHFIAEAQAFQKEAPFPLHLGPIISGDRFITPNNLDPKLIAQFDQPLGIDMESGAVAQVAHDLNIPFCIIRSISDQTFATQNEKAYQDHLTQAADRAATITLHLLQNYPVK